MANILRLGSRQVLDQLLRHERSGMLAAVRPVTLKPHAAPAEEQQTHDERNMKLGRPQSPHLTIYAPQLTSMLSISHRGTGMILAGYAVMFSAAAVALPESIPHYLEELECWDAVGNGLLVAAKAALAFPFSYHFWNGIRHLLWDFGNLLTLKEVYLSGYVMLALTFVTTGILVGL